MHNRLKSNIIAFKNEVHMAISKDYDEAKNADLCFRLFELIEAIRFSQTDSHHYMESLITNSKMDRFSLSSHKVEFLLSPLLVYKQKLLLMKTRSSDQLVNILTQLKQRISFFFLFNMIDKAELQELEYHRKNLLFEKMAMR